MTDSIEIIISDIQDDILVDLHEFIANDFAGVEQNLMHLHLDEQPLERIQHVQTFIKNIEGACQQTFIEPYVTYIHTAEDVLEAVAEGKLAINEHLSELLLLMIDQIRVASDSLLGQRSLDYKLLQELSGQLKAVLVAPESFDYERIGGLVRFFATKVHPDVTFCAVETSSDEAAPQPPVLCSISSAQHEVLVFPGVLDIKPISSGIGDIAATQRRALDSFKNLAQAVEMRSRLWAARSQKILYGCLLINRHLPDDLRVDEIQLRAAVYMHDAFMSVLPDNILFKSGKYNSMDIMLLQQHPVQAFEMMRLMPDWNEAANMVHQHHERYDGKGYPRGLSGGSIHLGAQIIALGDAFFALTHKRSDRAYQKSVLRAVMELNNEKGSQFGPVVIKAFNKAAVVFLKDNKQKKTVVEPAACRA